MIARRGMLAMLAGAALAPRSGASRPGLWADRATAWPLPLAGLAIAALLASIAPAAAQNGQPAGWKAVLIAGDDAERAFDNAVDAMADKLHSFGVPRKDIAELKASGEGAPVASQSNIAAAFAHLDPGPRDGCFFFMTSHGERGRGLVLARERAVLMPLWLGQLLGQACGARPTVAIVSGCFSGVYAENSPLDLPNRVILTAARADRPSFGCNAHRQYTIFDKCLLGSLDRGLPWRAVMDVTRTCVSGKEFDMGVKNPSEPRLFIGADERKLLAFQP